MIEIDWLIHYKCNYRCPYCFFEGYWEEVEKKNRYLPGREWTKTWEKMARRYGGLKLIITGGEPMIYPGFLDLVKGLSQFSAIAFDTNFSISEDEVKKTAKSLDPGRFSISLSFHPVFAKKASFLKNALVLKKAGFDLLIHYVAWPPQLKKMTEAKKDFVSEGFRFVPI
ncbi:MAG TPA: radical SAM protein, partial [bacterium]|nr:radical SAM protein [bacterium]